MKTKLTIGLLIISVLFSIFILPKVYSDSITVDCNEVLRCEVGECMAGKCVGEGAMSQQLYCENMKGVWVDSKCVKPIAQPINTQTNYSLPAVIIGIAIVIGFIILRRYLKNNKNEN